jgi:hypothetical protein
MSEFGCEPENIYSHGVFRILTSRPRDFHPRALPESYVNLSIHTAPYVRPLPWHSGQWAKSVGFARRSRSNQSLAPLESLVELRAAYMPDAARAVSGIPRADPGGRVIPPF